MIYRTKEILTGINAGIIRLKWLCTLVLFILFQSTAECSIDKSKENGSIKAAQKVQTQPDQSSIELPDTLEIKDIQIGCMDLKHLHEMVIVQSMEDFNAFLKRKLMIPDCNDCHLPDIDFTKKTLLGFKTLAGGCQQPEYNREITCDSSKKSCTYSITIKEIGKCKKAWFNMNWVVTNKIADDFIINCIRN